MIASTAKTLYLLVTLIPFAIERSNVKGKTNYYKKFDDALLQVVVNDLLNDESQESVQKLLEIGLKRKSAGVKRVLISEIVVNNKLTSARITSVNQRISNNCRDNSFVLIDNNNILTWSLFHDGLHLLEAGKRIKQ